MSGREMLERLRKRHVQAGAAEGDPQPSCLWCGNLQAWPCDQARLIAALEEALARIETAFREWHACHLSPEQAIAMGLPPNLLCDACTSSVAHHQEASLSKLVERSE